MEDYFDVPGPKGDLCVCDVCKKSLKVEEGYLAIPPWIELPQNQPEGIFAGSSASAGRFYL